MITEAYKNTLEWQILKICEANAFVDWDGRIINILMNKIIAKYGELHLAIYYSNAELEDIHQQSQHNLDTPMYSSFLVRNLVLGLFDYADTGMYHTIVTPKQRVRKTAKAKYGNITRRKL